MHEQSQNSTKTLIEYAPVTAHLVRLREDADGKAKIPIKAAWQDYPAERDLVDIAKVGLIPASIDSICIDVDGGGAAMRDRVIAELGDPWLLLESSPGRFHLWYRASKSTAPRAFTMRKVSNLIEFRYARCQVRIPDWSRHWLAWREVGAHQDPLHWAQILDLYETLNGEASNDGEVSNEWQEGTRNATLYKESQKAAGDDAKLQELADQAREVGLTDGEIESTQASAARSRIATERLKINRNWQGLADALSHIGCGLRYNVRWGRTEYYGVNGAMDWQAQANRYDCWLRQEVAKRCSVTNAKGQVQPAHFGAETFNLFAGALATVRETDPFGEWLMQLDPWDCVPRMSTLIERVFRVKQAQIDLVRWASRFLLCGTVERTLQPGRKLDEMPVLVGDQSIGKSTFVELLLPPEVPGLFGSGIDLRGDDRMRAEALQGRAIVEASELQGARRADLNSLKSFLSRCDDGVVRMAYERGTTEMPRRCVLVGTSNEQGCLPNDTSGNRRFVVLEVGRRMSVADMRTLLDDERRQLWAEALAWFGQGDETPSARLPDELADVQATVNEGFRANNQALEDAVLDALDGMSSYFTMSDLMTEAGLPTSQDKAVGGILRAAGCTKAVRKIKDKPRKVWIQPANS